MPKFPIQTHLSSAFASALTGKAKLPLARERADAYEGTRDSTLRKQREKNDTQASSYAQSGHPPRGYKFKDNDR